MIDRDTGRRREAYADELTQPQESFLFHAEEKRRAMRNGEDGDDGDVTETPGKKTSTHQIT